MKKSPRLQASQGSRDSLLSEREAEMVGAIQSHSCLGSCRARLSLQTPRCTQTHLDMATWTPASHGGRPGLSGSTRCRSLEGRRQAAPRSPSHPTSRLHFQTGQQLKGEETGRLFPSSPNFITQGDHCFFHYYFLSTMTINTLQRITHQWKAIQRILR